MLVYVVRGGFPRQPKLPQLNGPKSLKQAGSSPSAARSDSILHAFLCQNSHGREDDLMYGGKRNEGEKSTTPVM